jgi:Polysaccharide pyruvyl transferase
MTGVRTTKVLVTGWFSFVHGEATAGDLLARDVACRWLELAGRSYDVALSPAFEDGVDWRSVDPASYSEVVFVCGPAKGKQVDELARRFSGCRLVGLGVSMIEPLEDGHHFDVLLERDSSATSRPDLAFAARTEAVPVVGLILGHAQPEYGKRGMHDATHATIRRVLYDRRACVVPFDTRVDPRPGEFPGAFRSSPEVEALVARTDVVVTTRMHGMVHALKEGVPAVAVDPICQGAKISHQAEAVGWPVVLTADELSEKALHEALDYCLAPDARNSARSSAERAAELLQATCDEFVGALRDGHL